MYPDKQRFLAELFGSARSSGEEDNQTAILYIKDKKKSISSCIQKDSSVSPAEERNPFTAQGMGPADPERNPAAGDGRKRPPVTETAMPG